jgi:hypothetical protein
MTAGNPMLTARQAWKAHEAHHQKVNLLMNQSDEW